jgi:molybdenum cofactor guanylyltransferase
VRGPEPVGIVLAGGLGRRIGGAKAVVELRGRPLISYPLEAMQASLSDVMVLAKADTELPSLPGVTVWVESDPLRHPLVGIVEGLSAAAGRPVVVCAADLPFVTAELITGLAATAPHGASAVVTGCGEIVQPLLARYEQSAGPHLADALRASPPPRLRDAVGGLVSVRLEVEDPEVLFNVNAPEDLLRAAALIDAQRSSRT